ncbi:hypothetical protein B7C51_05285 [Paenibacillus larvae subsp. pulvifaciens]|uniref:chitinase n=1 Tax=Paenibacillus larvae subsp. pulvifaciens TaxID=1477 RepID=A0A1V0UQI3_9BACL|nr:glycoside hydrolase family 18 protein [Paenibacillus larvae]ARF67366.1 hypothetical protein B7C51_05285 [Paenibacillus larvae subsp. pulvifaciens]
MITMGPGEYTNHQSAVYKNPDDPNPPDIADNFNIDATAAKFEQLGVPKEKIIIGTPYYSRGWMGVDDKTGTNGMFAKAVPGPSKGPCGIWDDASQGECGGQNPFYYIKSNMETNSSFVKYRDPASKAPWLYSRSKKEMYTYEDEESLAFKADYINSKGYGGAIIWELSGDAPSKGSTLTTILYNKLLAGK